MGAVLYEDTLQQIHNGDKHAIKHEWLDAHDVTVVRVRFDGKHEPVPVSFGDYYREGSNVVVDTKRNIAEIAQNINGQQHNRFREECRRAQRDGYRLVMLIENDEDVICLKDLQKWTNTHCRFCSHFHKKQCDPHDSGITKCKRHGTRKPVQGERLAKAMQTMTDKYGVRFEFCKPDDSAMRICLALGVEYKSLCADCFRYDGGLCRAAHGMQLIEGPPQPVDGSKVMCEWGCPF